MINIIKALVGLSILFALVSIPLFVLLSLIGLLMNNFPLKHIIGICLMLLPMTIMVILFYFKVPTRFD